LGAFVPSTVLDTSIADPPHSTPLYPMVCNSSEYQHYYAVTDLTLVCCIRRACVIVVSAQLSPCECRARNVQCRPLPIVVVVGSLSSLILPTLLRWKVELPLPPFAFACYLIGTSVKSPSCGVDRRGCRGVTRLPRPSAGVPAPGYLRCLKWWAGLPDRDTPIHRLSAVRFDQPNRC
jgi:hypothetical protein